MVVINGVKANKNDISMLLRFYLLKKVKILFFKRGEHFINIITD